MSIVLNGTTGITAPDVSSPINGLAYPDAASVGFRNRLINANPIINQRSYVSGAATAAANQYTVDRWRVVTSGQNVSWTDSGLTRTLTCPAGGFEQVIESLNIEGGTFVLNWTGTATATVNGTAVAKGDTFTLPANTDATVRFSGGTLAEPQLEAGSVATPFERRPYGTELMLCQRYYEFGYSIFYQGVTNTYQYAAPVVYKVTKRASATVAGVNAVNTGFPTTFSALDANTNGFMQYRIANATRADGAFAINWTASAEL